MLRTERLLLRRPTLDDCDAAAAWLEDPEVMRFLGGETVPREDVPIVVQRWLDAWERFPAGKFLLERLEDGTVVGRVGFNFLDPETWEPSEAPDARPELGWALARAHWGNGYAAEAALAIRAWFGRDGVVSLVSPDNVRSARVAERLGARPSATVLHGGTPHLVWVHP